MDKTHLVDEITGHRRMRRNRKADWTRRLVQENRLTVDDLIWPIFIVPGTGIVDPIAAMPGVNRMSIDKAVEAVRKRPISAFRRSPPSPISRWRCATRPAPTAWSPTT